MGVKLRNEIGIDNICWEADYPHSDSMWPGAPEQLHEVLTKNDVPDDEVNKMTFEKRDALVSVGSVHPHQP